MTREEFEAQFREVIKDKFNVHSNKLGWHQFVEHNLHKLSHDALYYITENQDGYFFGDWMVRKAVDLIVFEEVVLKGK